METENFHENFITHIFTKNSHQIFLVKYNVGSVSGGTIQDALLSIICKSIFIFYFFLIWRLEIHGLTKSYNIDTIYRYVLRITDNIVRWAAKVKYPKLIQ
jgi:hypothetical protein